MYPALTIIIQNGDCCTNRVIYKVPLRVSHIKLYCECLSSLSVLVISDADTEALLRGVLIDGPSHGETRDIKVINSYKQRIAFEIHAERFNTYSNTCH